MIPDDNLSDVLDSTDSSEPINEPDLIGDEEILSEDKMEEDNKDTVKTIWFVAFAAILIGFFIWLFLGLWGYLQEMSYGHG
ncbi:MAG: hypothetical protein ABR986_01390 [Methanomassiliicoccales archaeon]|jgi:hypothetical protein